MHIPVSLFTWTVPKYCSVPLLSTIGIVDVDLASCWLCASGTSLRPDGLEAICLANRASGGVRSLISLGVEVLSVQGGYEKVWMMQLSTELALSRGGNKAAGRGALASVAFEAEEHVPARPVSEEDA